MREFDKEFYGESQVWLAGSRMHGTATPESDYDYVGVEFSPSRHVNPLKRPDYTDTNPEGDVRHSAAKFAKLLSVGNPNILDLVHNQPVHRQPFISGLISAVRPHSITSNVIRSYKGYLSEQKRRGLVQSSKHGVRKEQDLLGYDPKYLAHAVRLVFVFRGITDTGEYHYLTEDERSHVLHIRRGGLERDTVVPHVEELVDQALGFRAEGFPDADAHLNLIIQDYFNMYFIGGRS